jgi:hypothetical protein
MNALHQVITSWTIDDAREFLMKELHAASRRTDCYAIEWLIDPILAAAMMELNNPENRSKRKHAITKWTEDINRNRWLMTGEPIKFNTNNILDDGQHRLESIIAGGRPIKTLVAFNTDPKAFAVMDTGTKRSVADTLAHEGFNDPKSLAAVIRTHRLIKETKGVGRIPSDNTVAISYLEEHPDLPDALRAGARLRKRLEVSTSGPAAAYYVIQHDSRYSDQLEEFWEQLCSGVTVHRAITACRDNLMTGRYKGVRKLKGGGVKIPESAEAACKAAGTIINGWNAFVTKRVTSRIWDIVAGETFPEVL